MPEVGDKKFPYTKKGEKAAKKFGKKTGKKVKRYDPATQTYRAK